MPIVFVAFVFAAAALATASICRIHSLSFSDILRTRPLRYGTVATGLPAALAGIVAWWISDSWAVAATTALLAATPSLAWVSSARKRARRFMAPLDDSAIAALLADFRSRKPPEGSTSLLFETSLVVSAQQLVTAGRLDVAVELLALLDWDQIDGPVLSSGAYLLALSYLESGLTREARTALDKGKSQADKFGDRDRYAVLDARLLVHEGKHERALKRLGKLERIVAREPALRIDQQRLHIHALAASGEEEDAIALIGSLTREHGRDALALLARPAGPASSLAASLAQKNAYR